MKRPVTGGGAKVEGGEIRAYCTRRANLRAGVSAPEGKTNLLHIFVNCHPAAALVNFTQYPRKWPIILLCGKQKKRR
jgi:hypothetical protein